MEKLSFWEFLKLFFKTAFPKLHQIELWSFVVFTLIGIYCHFSQNGENQMNSLLWQVPLWVAASITAFRAVKTPYWIWKDNQKTIAQKKEIIDQKQKEIDDIKVQTQKEKSNHYKTRV